MKKDVKAQEEAYATLEQTIGGCFGSADRLFAGHPSDLESAKEKKKLIKKHDLDKARVQSIIEKYLYEEGVHSTHLKEQVEVAMEFFFP
ncbi:MAG: hypothetical protein H6590_00795 [Flavobacteriales bacterium]|nr:hypothetical protein [Flavobacteriales bacterium]